jgi:hypothetical protein
MAVTIINVVVAADANILGVMHRGRKRNIVR